MINNYTRMPFLLKIILGASFLAPVLVLGTILTGGLGVVGGEPTTGYGYASNAVELLLVFLSSLPISLCAIFIIRGNSRSKYWFIISWVVLIGSPVFMESTRNNIDIFLLESLFGLLVGVALSFYIAVGTGSK